MAVVLVTHLICAAAFATLAGILLLGQERTPVTNALAVASISTVMWAAMAAFHNEVPPSLVALVESLRNLAWLLFLCRLLVPTEAPLTGLARNARSGCIETHAALCA